MPISGMIPPVTHPIAGMAIEDASAFSATFKISGMPTDSHVRHTFLHIPDVFDNLNVL